MHAFIGLPPFEGKVHAQTVMSLITEDRLARELGVDLSIVVLAGAHYPSHAYNALWAKFLDTPCEKFVSVEWDVSWKPGDLLRLLATPHHYVGAATRYKREPEEYMVGWKLGDELWADKHGCIEVDWIPQGLSCASRSMVEQMWEAAQDRPYALADGTQTRQVFRDGFSGDGFYSQDTRLCEEWRAMGGKIHVMPDLTTTHTACVGHSYTGSLGDWLRSRMKEAA